MSRSLFAPRFSQRTTLLLALAGVLSFGPHLLAQDPGSADAEAAADLEARDLEVLGALQRSIARARDRVFPALINVEPIIEDYSGGRKVKQRATGSGVIIDDQGHAITNYHVAGKAKLLYCTLSDKQRITADLVGSDPQTDIAVIRLHLDELRGELATAKLGNSHELEVGEYVMAMGSPLALARSLTLGVVSNVERVMGVNGDMEIEEGQKTGMFNLWIQTDAAINPGNSGGPLVNMSGEVVGINTRGAMLANTIGFSVPIDIVKDVVAQILENGEVTRAWTGLKLQPRIVEKGEELQEGVLVADVADSSPAQRAGIRPGDVIKSVGGEEIRANYIEEIPPILNKMAKLEPKKPVAVELERDGKKLEFTMITQTLEDYLGEDHEIEEWGVTVREITDHMRREHRLDSSDGVMITGIAPGKAFSRASPSLRQDDVLRELGGRPIASLDDLRTVSGEFIGEKREKLIVSFVRGRTNMVGMVEAEYEDEDGEGDSADPASGEGTAPESDDPTPEDTAPEDGE